MVVSVVESSLEPWLCIWAALWAMACAYMAYHGLGFGFFARGFPPREASAFRTTTQPRIIIKFQVFLVGFLEAPPVGTGVSAAGVSDEEVRS